MPSSQGARAAGGLSPSGSESRYQDLLDRLPQTVFEVDLDGGFVYVNRTGIETFGYTREELSGGLTVSALVAPEDRERLRSNIARRLSGGAPEGMRYTAVRKDGSTFPILVHSTVIHRDGRPVGLQGYLVDISEGLKIEGDLQRRVALERLIMRISTQLVAELLPRELDARIDEALGEIGRFMGADRSYVFLFSPDGALMDNTHEWVAEGISAERNRLQQVPVEAAFPWFTRQIRQDHVVAVSEVAAMPAEAAAERAEFEREGIQSIINVAMIHGGHTGGFLGLDAVRSRHTWTEDEIALLRIIGEILMGALGRQRAEHALRESERKYKTLVETTATGFVILDDRGLVLDANPEYVRMTGHRGMEEIRGRSVVDWTAPHDRARNEEAVRECLRKGYVRDLQVDYAQPDGHLVPVLINATVTGSEGVPQIISMIRDMSDRKRLESELLRSEKLRSVGVLAGGIAHDFNNILTAILGNVSLLQAALRTDRRAIEHLDEVESASTRARELTRQLLTFSHGGDPVRRPFEPEPLLRESAILALRGRGSACEFAIAPGLPLLDGDEGQIGQVIRNLVINASQAMQGTGTVRLGASACSVRDREVHALAPGTYVTISVADSGCGISEANRQQIFDPYFTTKSDGRGLGLAVSHSIVSNHGGAITVESRPGHGAVFVVFLPTAKQVQAPTSPPTPQLLPGHGRVLIMDDEEGVRQVAGKIVSALGYEAAYARDGGEALASWRQAQQDGAPFAAVIMDLTVPGGMGGREAMRELLAIDPDAKGIVSSGYSGDPVLANYREHGFSEILAKPYRLADVSRVLSAVLRSR